jgi:hypothetical protein
MKTLTVALIITIGIAIVGIILFMEISKTSTSDVFRLSATAETSPNNIKIHSLEQLSAFDYNTTTLDNSTLDKVPALKNAIDQAFSRFVPPPFHGSHTFAMQISQSDANSILNLAGDKVEQLHDTQTNDINLGVNFTTQTSVMEFKFDNFYYHVVIEKLVSSQSNQTSNFPYP